MKVIHQKWKNPISEPPKDNVVVEVVAPDGRETKLFKQGRLWFVPDGSMYMYWTPVLWREITDAED